MPERPGGDGPNYVTPQGYAGLKRRYEDVLARRSEMASKPGAGVDPEFRRLERDLRYLEKRLAAATVVDRSKDAQAPEDARFGAVVVVRDEAGDHSYSIVGEDEAEPARGRLAWSAPLAMALMGAKPGDEVHWEGPQGETRARVVSVSYR